MSNKSALDWIAIILAIIGSINWGLVGLFDLNIVESILGTSIIATIVYVLVGLSGIYLIYYATKK
ncbi:DUF378 domain-containing protein [Candidatus Woesearchaeota archaeon]|nr:DUF378 domain-containing protein [Candidatus Woesearchaeota archaeon]